MRVCVTGKFNEYHIEVAIILHKMRKERLGYIYLIIEVALVVYSWRIIQFSEFVDIKKVVKELLVLDSSTLYFRFIGYNVHKSNTENLF